MAMQMLNKPDTAGSAMIKVDEPGRLHKPK